MIGVFLYKEKSFYWMKSVSEMIIDVNRDEVRQNGVLHVSGNVQEE